MRAPTIPLAMPMHSQRIFLFYWMLIYLFYPVTDYNMSHDDNASHAHVWPALFVSFFFLLFFFWKTNYFLKVVMMRATMTMPVTHAYDNDTTSKWCVLFVCFLFFFFLITNFLLSNSWQLQYQWCPHQLCKPWWWWRHPCQWQCHQWPFFFFFSFLFFFFCFSNNFFFFSNTNI